MVTGDNELVAKNVAQQVGIKHEYLQWLYFILALKYFKLFFIGLEMSFAKFLQTAKQN